MIMTKIECIGICGAIITLLLLCATVLSLITHSVMFPKELAPDWVVWNLGATLISMGVMIAAVLTMNKNRT